MGPNKYQEDKQRRQGSRSGEAAVLCGVFVCAQLCPGLCNPMDCSLPVSSVHGFPGKNTGVDCHFLFQGIFPTQGSNLGLISSIVGRFFNI